MGFLQQLKDRATDVQARQGQASRDLDEQLTHTEAACQRVWQYLSELAAQLNILQPSARPLALDARAPWPAMRLADFRFDARRKILRSREVFEHLAMGWRVVPVDPACPPQSEVSVNFPPDLARVEARLAAGQVRFNRVEERNPDTNKLLAVRFEHDMAARGSVVFTPEHDQGRVHLRLQGVVGFQVQTLVLAAHEVSTDRLDDLARAIVGDLDVFL